MALVELLLESVGAAGDQTSLNQLSLVNSRLRASLIGGLFMMMAILCVSDQDLIENSCACTNIR